MGKSKSHPCTHPTTARRIVDDDVRCVKCGFKIDPETGERIKEITLG